jgi:hypothetical protein
MPTAASATSADAQSRWSAWDLLLAGVGAYLALRLFRVAEAGDADFHVYWRAAHDFAAGRFPYRVASEDGGFVFKYPPWTLPWFYPLSWLSWDAARGIWFAAEIFCTGYCVRWVTRQGVSSRLAGMAALVFWWIWRAHFEFGQFTVILLAIALWACPRESSEGGYPVRTGLTGFFFTAKLFSVVTMAGMLDRLRRPGPWLIGAGTLVASMIFVAVVGPHTSLSEYFRGWLQAASSGGAALGEVVIRGPQNHSFTTRILAAVGVSAVHTEADLIVSFVLMAVFGWLWWRFGRALTFAERWSGWIALGVITHPIAWDHSFVMAYPLCALSLARAWRSGDRRVRVLSVVGIGLIGLMVPQLWGAGFVKPVELAANKCWGVVCSAVALAWARQLGRSRTG